LYLNYQIKFQYIKNNFPKDGFVYDRETRLKLDKIVSKDIISMGNDGTIFIVDSGSILEEGRKLYKSENVKTLVVYIKTPMWVCLLRDIKRSLQNKSPIKNWIYLRAIKSKIFNLIH
jgi:adenylylsulfate kinase-like enzyme